MNNDYSQWRSDLATHFEGRWESVLPLLVSDSEIISDLFKQNKNVTCPVCGSKRKFYMRDTTTARSLCCKPTCKTCAYDGIALAKILGGYNSEVEVCKDLDKLFSDEVRHLNRNKDSDFKKQSPYAKPVFKNTPSKALKKKEPPQKKPKAEKTHTRLLNQIVSLDDDSAELARSYLRERGINVEKLMPNLKHTLFFHPNLNYYYVEEADNDEDEDVIIKGYFPAIIAKIFCRQGNLIGFHRIYLDKVSGKAKVPEAKLLVPPLFKDGYSELGCIVPLCQASEVMGIAEGIETALSIIDNGHPCWSLIDAYKFSTFVPPKNVKVINVFCDLDTSGTGQSVGMDLFIRLKAERPEITVNLLLPPLKYWDIKKYPKGIDFLNAFNMGYKLPIQYQILEAA